MASETHCCYVFETLSAHFDKRPVKSIADLRQTLGEPVGALGDQDAAPLFVTYNTLRKDRNKRLRGCIGTFSKRPLEPTLKRYAMEAAMRDSRFAKIEQRELSSLEAVVSILTDFEEIEDPYDWVVGTHGLQVHFMFNGRGRSATFLPDVAPEQGWTQDDTLQHLFRKGGWDGSGDWRDLPVDLERYQSTKRSISYSRYLELVKTSE